MATERDLELLDDYLTNRLNAQDRVAFETKLEADPDLKSEYNLQQRLVKGIQSARVAELKGMLNNIPVAPVGTGGSALIGKLAAGTFVVGAVIIGIYLYNNRGEETQTTQQVETPVQQPEQNATEPNAQTETDSTPEEKRQDVAAQPENTNAASKPEVTTTVPQEDSEVVAERTPIKVYDPNEEAEGDKSEDAAEPVSTEARPAGAAIIVEVDKTNKKYNFHYQFRGGRLYLYGPFEKPLYEILEFFGADDKRTTFLYYKEGYYLLKEDGTEKIKALTPITDAVLIQKLTEYRKK